MSIISNPDFLQYVVLLIARDRFDIEVGDPENLVELGFESPEEWIAGFIEEYFDRAKKKLVNFDFKQFPKMSQQSLSVASKLYSLDLGQSFDFDNFTTITRMPGGWLYQSKDPQTTQQTFIPYHKEFSTDSEGVKDGPAEVSTT